MDGLVIGGREGGWGGVKESGRLGRTCVGEGFVEREARRGRGRERRKREGGKMERGSTMPRRVNQGGARLYYGVQQRRRKGVGRGRKERREGEGGD